MEPEPINRSLVVIALLPPDPALPPASIVVVIPEFTPDLYQYFFHVPDAKIVMVSISKSESEAPARNFEVVESWISVEGMISVKSKSIPKGLFAIKVFPDSGR